MMGDFISGFIMGFVMGIGVTLFFWIYTIGEIFKKLDKREEK